MTVCRTRGLGLVVVVALLAASSSDAAAQARAGRGEARRQYDRGQELYKNGRYLDAARAFEAGYAANPRPAFLINIGQSYRLAGDLDKARRYYQIFVDTQPDSSQRADVQQIVAEIDVDLAAQRARQEAADRQAAAPPEPPPVAPPPAPPPPPPKPKPRPLLTRWWVWAAVGVVAIGAAGVWAYEHRND